MAKGRASALLRIAAWTCAGLAPFATSWFVGCGGELEHAPGWGGQACPEGSEFVNGVCVGEPDEAGPVKEAGKPDTGVPGQCGMAPCLQGDKAILYFRGSGPDDEFLTGEQVAKNLDPAWQEATRVVLASGPLGVTLDTKDLGDEITANTTYENAGSPGIADGSTAMFDLWAGNGPCDSISQVTVHENSPLSCDGGACPDGAPVRISMEWTRECLYKKSTVCGCGFQEILPDAGADAADATGD